MYDTILGARRDTKVKTNPYAQRNDNFVGKIRFICKATLNKHIIAFSIN